VVSCIITVIRALWDDAPVKRAPSGRHRLLLRKDVRPATFRRQKVPRRAVHAAARHRIAVHRDIGAGG